GLDQQLATVKYADLAGQAITIFQPDGIGQGGQRESAKREAKQGSKKHRSAQIWSGIIERLALSLCILLQQPQTAERESGSFPTRRPALPRKRHMHEPSPLLPPGADAEARRAAVYLVMAQ